VQELLLFGARWKYRLSERLGLMRRPTVNVAVMATLLGLIIALNHSVGPTFAFGGPYAITICVTAWLTGFRPAFVLGVMTICATAYLNGAGGPYAGPANALATSEDWISLVLRALSLLAICHLIAGVRAKYALIQQQASRDPLTGLHNHCAFHEHLDIAIERAARGGTVLALAYLDLDEFKGMNDRFGHVIGDRMLKYFAQAARESVRRTDCIGRLGGDEFAIVIEARTKAEVTLAVSRAYDALKTALLAREAPRDQILSFSMGAVIAGALDRLDANSLIHAADSLMYRSKRAGKGSLTISDLGLPGSTVRPPVAPHAGDPATYATIMPAITGQLLAHPVPATPVLTSQPPAFVESRRSAAG
jgi:diguanylate cyclase (GGDEF)-like protein